jgi:hypothetical protein
MTTNFKVGQKVVFVRGNADNINAVMPKKNETVTIAGCDYFRNDYFSLIGYEFSKDNIIQWFHKDCLRPLVYESLSATLASTCLKETQIETSDTPIKDPSPKPEKETV